MNCFYIFLPSFLLQNYLRCFFNNSKSVVEWLLSAIKKTDHVISPNQTVSYKSRFYRRGLLKVSWQKSVFEKPKSGDIKKTSKNTACWEPKALWIKVLWKKVCFNKQSLEKKKTSKMTACWEPEALWIKILWQKSLFEKENIARIANAVQVTICLLVSTSVF